MDSREYTIREFYTIIIESIGGEAHPMWTLWSQPRNIISSISKFIETHFHQYGYGYSTSYFCQKVAILSVNSSEF